MLLETSWLMLWFREAASLEYLWKQCQVLRILWWQRTAVEARYYEQILRTFPFTIWVLYCAIYLHAGSDAQPITNQKISPCCWPVHLRVSRYVFSVPCCQWCATHHQPKMPVYEQRGSSKLPCVHMQIKNPNYLHAEPGCAEIYGKAHVRLWTRCLYACLHHAWAFHLSYQDGENAPSSSW